MNELLLALIIFLLRILNNAVSTIRVVFIARQQTGIAALLALVESTIFAYTVANVVNDLNNPLMLMAYSGGFAVGSYVGMELERRLVKGFLTVNVILNGGGRELANVLRAADFGVTETQGEGKEGRVTMLRITVERRESKRLLDMIRESQPTAFISVEETRAIRSGYFAPHGRR